MLRLEIIGVNHVIWNKIEYNTIPEFFLNFHQINLNITANILTMKNNDCITY